MRKGSGPPNYQRVWENLAARAPEQQRIARIRRQTAEQLLADLLADPPESWIAKIRQGERYRSQDLFDLLVEDSHGALPFEPRRAFEVSKVAVELGRLLSVQPEDCQATEETLCRALCLGGHALRLLGEREQADGLLGRAAYFTNDPAARGFFCRALGLLRWDQGRQEEAEALLHQATRRYRELGDKSEEAVCAALLGLLYSSSDDGGDWARAEPALLQAQSGLTHQRPWLAAQAQLALARCQAFKGRWAEAKALRQSVSAFYPQIPGEDALASLLWLEARVSADLGDLDAAGTLLDSVRRRFIARGYLPEATLTTLQLSWIRVRQGRAAETIKLSDGLREVFEGAEGFDVSTRALHFLAKEAARVRPKALSFVYPKLFLSFRSRGVYPRPVPLV